MERIFMWNKLFWWSNLEFKYLCVLVSSTYVSIHRRMLGLWIYSI